jgi:hypothetical protein
MLAPKFEMIAPYLKHSLSYDVTRYENIKNYLIQDLGYLHVSGCLGFHSSSSVFQLSFDEKWIMVPAQTAMWDYKYNTHIHVSERGPFVTARGLEHFPTPADEYRPPGFDKGVLLESPIAEAKAKEIALQIAEKFSLTYLDHHWLSQFKINEKDMPADAIGLIDFSEPDALNVLFAEIL